MNIKSLTGLFVPQQIKKVDRKTANASADRDPSSQGEEEQKQNKKMTDEDLAKALEFLKSLKGVQDNNLQLRVERKDDILIVFVEDINGKVVRRIAESELWQLTHDREKSKGNLFDKSM